MILGITGTLGSGKGVMAQYLVQHHNFAYYSVRNFIAGEVLKRGLMVNRETITATALDLQKTNGSDYLLKQLFERALHEKHDVIIESVRTKGEVDFLRAHGGQLWAVDATIGQRYARAQHMPDVPPMTLEEFTAKDRQDISSVDRVVDLNALRAMADVMIINNGTKEELYQQIEKALTLKK